MPNRAKSLCKGKRIANPNKCKKVRGCKIATGKKRTYCRKTRSRRNKTQKQRKQMNKLQGYKRFIIIQK